MRIGVASVCFYFRRYEYAALHHPSIPSHGEPAQELLFQRVSVWQTKEPVHFNAWQAGKQILRGNERATILPLNFHLPWVPK